MAKAHMCDKCKKLIAEDDIRINLYGYDVIQNKKSRKMPKGYDIRQPQDFCSFTCLAAWANEEQAMFEDYIKATEKYRRVDNE